MSIKQKVMYTVRWILGKQLRVRKQERQTYKKMGGDYGGFAVSLDALPINPIVYSFGVGEDVSFDLDLLEQTNATVYAYDPTPKAIAFLDTLSLPQGFIFAAYAVTDADKELTFYLPNNPNFVSGSLDNTSNVGGSGSIIVTGKKVSSLMAINNHKRIDLIKMNIEGSEFDVVEDILKDGIDFKQICMETHARFFSNGKERLRTMIARLNECGYWIFAVSDNGKDISFLKD